MTLNDLYWRWRLERSTTSDIARVLRFVRLMGKESEASALTEGLVSAYLVELRAVTLSDRTYQNHVVTVRAFLNFAVRAGVLPFNPMRHLLLPIWNKRIKRSHPRVMRPESGTRAMSLGSTPLESAERKELVQIEEELRHEGISTVRPRQLSECPPDKQPCPWAGCRHHLGTEVSRYGETGTAMVKLTWPGVDLDATPETCSLRAARRFALRAKRFPRTRRAFEVVASADEVSRLMNLTPMRVSQIEDGALAKLRLALEAVGG